MREEAGRRPSFLTWVAGWVVMPFTRRTQEDEQVWGDESEGDRLGHVGSEAGGEGSYSPRMC